MTNWWKELKGKVKFGEPLKGHTSFKIGGPAEFFIEPKDIEDLRLLISLRKKYKLPFLVIGAGTNILVSDAGVKGIVARLSSPYFKKVSFDNNYAQARGGVILSRLINAAGKRGLSGLEFMSGMPGTVAGAVAMNAGTLERSIADLVEEILVIDDNANIKILPRNKIKFAYRKSNLDKFIILSARFKLSRKNKGKIKNEILRCLDYRRLTQDLVSYSAGCIFKNPPGVSAGRLIDLCGLKGRRIKGAEVSKIHANFIVNRQGAQAKDILELMDLVKSSVKKKFGVSLTPEIKIWK